MSNSLLVIFLLFIFVLCQVHASWVDPDTKEEYYSITSNVDTDNRNYKLVFSDEFERDGRTFHDGNDPRWTALQKNDYTNDALHYYSHDNVITKNGVLSIHVEQKVNLYKAFDENNKKFYADKKYIQSGMVQGWNKFCITGGIIEISAKLPGEPNIGGLWPALWLMGNLARATYVGSSDYMWPYSYSKCNLKRVHSQEINACMEVSHYGLESGKGRGAPEIDILETMQGIDDKLPHTNVTRPYLSASYQVAPGLQKKRPILGQLPKEGNWYSNIEYGNETNAEINPFFYGVTLVHKPKSYTYQSDALSANMHLSKSHYQNQHIYRVEWEPPEVDGSGGHIKWFIDGKLMFGIHGDSLNLTGSEIPSEPMYMLMNIAVSKNWGFPMPCPGGCDCTCFECGNSDCECAIPEGYCNNFPADMEVEYVRVYQAVNESKHILGCSPTVRPTESFIKGHRKRYMEEGQKVPLLPIQQGGAKCENDNNCGGIKMGECYGGHCQCIDKTTGPACLASDGFYDHEDKEKKVPFEWDFIYVPKSLIISVMILIGGFFPSMLLIIHKNRKQAQYQSLINGSVPSHSGQVRPLSRETLAYQNSVPSDYVVPRNDKVVTYCVIDGRLVDK